MSTFARTGKAQIKYNNQPLIAVTKWTEDLKSNSSIIDCVGVSAVSRKPSTVTVTFTSAVLVDGEEQDYRAVVKSGATVVMEVWETGGWKPMYKGILNSYKRDGGVDVDDMSDVAFTGKSVG